METRFQFAKVKGFTLLEIMIVVAVIATLAAIAVPNYLRARKRSQAGQIISELRVLDGAIQFYVIDHNKSESSNFTLADILPYAKSNSRLAESSGVDILGNPFVINPPDPVPKVSPVTFSALSSVAPRSFWSPYIQ